MLKEYTCIVCPNGCEITAEYEGDPAQAVITGAGCRRGNVYVMQELTDPRRTFATSVAVRNGTMPLVSVRVTSPVPLDRIPEAVRRIHGITAEAPVKAGDVLFKGLLDMDCDVIATRNVPERQ